MANISRKKFNTLNATERRILAESINYTPKDDEDLFNELNHLWGKSVASATYILNGWKSDPQEFVKIVSKLK